MKTLKILWRIKNFYLTLRFYIILLIIKKLISL